MSSFTSKLRVTPMPDGRTWQLCAPFSYRIGSPHSRKVVKVPKGFKTDFASVPKFLWFLPYWAKYSKAPVLHDCLYHTKAICGKPINRKTADTVFLHAMHIDWREHKSRYFVAKLEYYAVRLCGWLAWKKKRENTNGL